MASVSCIANLGFGDCILCWLVLQVPASRAGPDSEGGRLDKEMRNIPIIDCMRKEEAKMKD